MANGEGNLEGIAALNRATELLLRLKIHEIKGERSQSEMILYLDTLGFKAGEIIRLLGATAATVHPVLSRGRKNKNKKKRKKK